jgi:hypothetical protein
VKSLQTLFLAFLCVVLSAYKVAADVPNPGFNSLFIGHSFFKPFADGMPNYAAAVGIAGHSQLVVFSGGATGAPLALWNNPTKSAEIKAYLNSGDVELFGMTYAPEYPTTEGYKNWIDYALAKNPNTRFALALPWQDFPENYDSATYANYWNLGHTTGWHDFVDEIRALYPGVDIYCIPYGQISGELYVRFDANNLPNYPTNVQNLVGAAETSIYKDEKGHPGFILRDLGRLVWLNAIYDVDLLAGSVGAFTNDFKAIAQTTIMDAHDPAYDAAYHNDIDGDRVGDSVDNCISTPNPDQELAIGYTDCGAACVVVACGAASCTNQ